MKRLSLHEPKFHGSEVKYLKKCIKSTWVSTSGEYIEKFEKIIHTRNQNLQLPVIVELRHYI